MDVRQPAVNPIVPVAQLGVLDPEQVQHGGVDIVAVSWLLHRFVGPLIGCAIAYPALDSAARHPRSKSERIVIPPFAPLAARHPTELGGPMHDRIFKQPPGLQVFDQSRHRFIHCHPHIPMILRQILVAVPVSAGKSVVGTAPQLHEAHAAFEQSPRHQTPFAHIRRQRIIHAVQLPRRRGLARHRHHLRRAQLQPRRHFVGLYPGFQTSIFPTPVLMGAIHLLQQRQPRPLALRGEVRRFWRKQVMNRIRGPDPNRRRLMRRRQESRRPVRRTVRRHAPRIRQHNKHREIVVHAPQRIGNPRPRARKPRQYESGVLHERGRPVDIRLRNHRMHKRHIVHARRLMRKQIAHPFPALTTLLPGPRARHDRSRVTLEQFHLLARIPLLTGLLNQQRLVVEAIALRRSPGKKDLHHTLRPRLGSLCALQHLRQRDAAQPPAVSPQKVASSHIPSIHEKKLIRVE